MSREDFSDALRFVGVLGAIIAGAFLLVFLLVAAAVWLAPQARAHSFYPWECCHDQDCWPMGLKADGSPEREPEPAFTPAGWRLHDGTLVPHNATRPSPDGRFHVCRRGGQAEGEVIRPPNAVPCLWVPMGAS